MLQPMCDQSRNSGGPMFDSDGKLIGINGRGSFESEAVSCRRCYAISINQIQAIHWSVKSGRMVDHASLGANGLDRRQTPRRR